MALIIRSLLAVQDIYAHPIGNVAERRVDIVLQPQALVARMRNPRTELWQHLLLTTDIEPMEGIARRIGLAVVIEAIVILRKAFTAARMSFLTRCLCILQDIRSDSKQQQ